MCRTQKTRPVRVVGATGRGSGSGSGESRCKPYFYRSGPFVRYEVPPFVEEDIQARDEGMFVLGVSDR